MDKKEGLVGLIGRTIDHRYKPKRLIRETSKSWVFEAVEEGELSPHRSVALKILKPGLGREREAQFEREVNTHGKLGEHPNVASLFSSGKDGEYLYAAMELVPGEDLDQRLRSGWKPSLDEILNIAEDVSKGASHIHERVGGHHDLKSKNIKIREEGERKLYVLDLGGRLREVEDSDDIHAMGNILKELLDHRQDPEEKIPRGLEQIVEKSTSSGGYSSPEDFKNAIESYRRSVKRGITRRKFLKVTGSSLVLASLSYSSYKYLDYRNSIDYIVEQIAQIEASDYEKIDPLFRELAFRIFNHKIRWLVEEEKIPRGKFPYAISKGGTEWSNTDGTYWSDGFWIGILWRAYERTKNLLFRDWAIDWADAMLFTERDNLTINPIRFYYSHALGYDITKDENFLEKSLQAADLISGRFNENGGLIQMIGEIDNSDTREIQIDAMTTALPLLSWAYAQTNDNYLRNIIVRHSDTTIKYNVNGDGSTIQIVEFNPETMARIRGIKIGGFDGDSCLSRGQARAIKGFTRAYRTTNERRFLEIAERCANYFIDNLPEDKVPFYDFKDPNKDIPKDSSAAAIASSGLLDLFNLTSKIKYRLSAREILKSLSIKYLSKEEDYQGLLLHACSNKNKGANIDVSVTYGDYHFTNALNKI